MKIYPHHIQGNKCPGCDARLINADPEVQRAFYALKKENPFLHCSWIFRDREDQENAFNAGESRLHFPNSRHNEMPSKAMDLFQLNIMGKAIFDPIYCAKLKHRLDELGFKFRWGGDFKTLGDSGHFELA